MINIQGDGGVGAALAIVVFLLMIAALISVIVIAVQLTRIRSHLAPFESDSMHTCPHCLLPIPRRADVCFRCGRDVT